MYVRLTLVSTVDAERSINLWEHLCNINLVNSVKCIWVY